MRRGQVGVILVIVSGLFSVLLAVAVNVATGGALPDPLAPYAWVAWPAVGVLALVGIGLGVWQLRLIDPAPPVASSGPVPAELPAAAKLFGREADVAAVDQALRDGTRVVVLTAAPGTGKTALAVRIAHDQRSRFPDGQLYATLRGASADPVPPDTVLTRFLGALGRPDDERRGTTEELAARFRSVVADRAILIVLDDARDAAQVRPLLPGGARCVTLVTGRRLIADLPGAVGFPLGGLSDPEALALLSGGGRPGPDRGGPGRRPADRRGVRRAAARRPHHGWPAARAVPVDADGAGRPVG